LLAAFKIYNEKSKRKCLPLEGRDNRLMKKGEEEINVSNAETSFAKIFIGCFVFDSKFKRNKYRYLCRNFTTRFFACGMKLKKGHYFRPVACFLI
jgi:hypothetical protein